MKTPVLKRLLLSIFVLICAIFVVFWSIKNYQSANRAQSGDGKIRIVASTNVWGDIASQVGGEHVEVTSILSDPSADPHLFESDAQTASQIASAQIVVTNGLGYDEFMNKLLDVAPDKNRIILTASTIMGSKADANPHLWYDLVRVPEVAVAIQDQLIKIDPANANEYRQNTIKFTASLAPALAEFNKAHQGGVAYTERLPQYIVQSLQLTDLSPLSFTESVENGIEPSPQQVQEFESLLKSGRIKVLLYNNQTTNDVTEQIKKTAQTAGVAVVGVSETLPKGKNFHTWQLGQLRAILEAL